MTFLTKGSSKRRMPEIFWIILVLFKKYIASHCDYFNMKLITNSGVFSFSSFFFVCHVGTFIFLPLCSDTNLNVKEKISLLKM